MLLTGMSAENVIEAELRYLVPTREKPVYYASEGGKEARLDMAGEFEMHKVPVHDGRYQNDAGAGTDTFSLDREGFKLVHHDTSVKNLYDESEIREHYLGEAEALVKQQVGATRVVAFDYTLRADEQEIRQARTTREPSSVVHNDYTPRSGPRRVRDILGDEAEAALAGHFIIVNVWRSIRNPVVSTPLAVCDAQSVEPDDLIATERRARDRTGELYLATFNPAHRWYYFSDMKPDEALLIKTFDSSDDGRARSCIHTAFTNPGAPAGTPPRESIEVRTFAFFNP